MKKILMGLKILQKKRVKEPLGVSYDGGRLEERAEQYYNETYGTKQ